MKKSVAMTQERVSEIVTAAMMAPAEIKKVISFRTGKEVTYGELFNLFVERNRDLARYIRDYRPGGIYALLVWFTDGTTCIVRWIEELNTFTIIKEEI